MLFNSSIIRGMNWLFEFLNTLNAGSSLIIVVLISCFWNLNLKIKHIKELLSNHITDTNKKIDKLEIGQANLKAYFEAELKEFKKEVRDKFEKILERLPHRKD